MNLDELIEEIKERMLHYDLSDAYLSHNGNRTREDVGISECYTGITMIPCSWVIKFLDELSERRSKDGSK